MSSPRAAFVHPADELVQLMERIYRYRMTTTSGGNLSVVDDNGDLWITPSRVDKGTLRAQDIVCVKSDGSVEGLHPPSSEFPFHRQIYAARPDLRAIVHAHPVALVAFSICRRTPDTRLLPHAWQVCGEVGYAPYALPGSAELGAHIAAVFARGFNSVMLENHGIVIGGATLQEAFERFETLEFTARTLIKCGQLGGARPLTEAQIATTRARDIDFPEFEPVPASTREKAVRRDLCRFVRRGYQQRLKTSTEGTFSARLGPDQFVITSYRVDRQTVEPADLTLISRGCAEAGKRPSRATRLHQLIYERHPDVHAIVNALPVNATAFSASAATLDARTIPESYIFLRDIPKLPFPHVYEEEESVARAVSPQQPVALLENDGALILGTSILDAFDRLEVLESTADALIQTAAIGPVVPMEDAAIRELVRVFLGGA